MLDRESTFKDPQIVELLRQRFIPVAIDQWSTRRQKDTEGEFYRKIAGQGPRHDFENTTQGLYIADAAGRLITYNNNRGPERIRALLQKSLDEPTPTAATPIVRESVDARFHSQLPDGALVVRVSAKVLDGYESPRDQWQSIFQSAVSRDNLWVTNAEQQSLLSGEFDPQLAQRIVRFHLVDNTRGEPPTWRGEEIRTLDLRIANGRIDGAVLLETDDHSRGFDAKISGQLIASDGRITRLDLLAEGEFWGTGRYTMEPPAGKFPLVVAFQLADGSDIADSIPPHAARGWLAGYLNPQ